jgi:ATP-dependent Clp protease protease subunit
MSKVTNGFEEAFMSMKKTPSFLEFTHWEELKERKIVLNDEVDEFLVEEVIMPIIKWNEQDAKAEEDYKTQSGILLPIRKPITIYLNSRGGEVFVGLVIAEVIKKSVTPVHIVALSIAASMASVILVSGHKRFAYEFSNVLLHDGSTMIAGSTNKVKDHMKFYAEKSEQIKQFILSGTKITEEKYDEMSDREWWLTAKSALEYGIIDEVIGGFSSNEPAN